MKPSRWQLIEQSFHELVDRPYAEQTAALRELELRDPDVATEVRAMIDADRAGHSILHRQPGAVAHELLADSAALPTEPFGPYRVTALLGAGGMGVVYLAKRADINALAAIKVLRDAWLSPDRRERFLVEQRTLASLEHPGIARLLDADRLPDGTPWFAMEYVEGISITQQCWQQKLSVGERLRLFVQAAEAVRFAHERGVIHRDIKPGNILVGRDGRVKLLDFGIAKTLQATEGLTDPTRTQQRMLTPAYAAPELLRGSPVGVQCDVYALGVVLYEMLTANRPYDIEALNSADAAALIEGQGALRVSAAGLRTHDAGSFEDLSRGARADLDALVACAMHPDPKRRYRSVDALLADVERFHRQQPLAAQPDSVGYRTQKFLARHWRAAAILVLAAGVGTAGLITYTTRINNARALAEAEAARVSRLKDFLVSLFDGGDAAGGPTSTPSVIDLIENGIRESRVRTTDPKLQADLYGVLGYAAGRLGKRAVADSLLRESLALQRQIYGAESKEAVKASITFASLLGYVGKRDTAMALFRAADAAARRSLPESEPVRALAAEQLGAALSETDSLTKAIELLNEAVRLRAAVDSTSTAYSDALNALANATYYTQNFARAESLNLEVLRVVERAKGPKHPSQVVTYMNLGNIALSDGRFADAEQWARRALALAEPYFGPNHYLTGRVLKQLGQTLSNQGKNPEARPHLLRALEIQEKVYGPNSGLMVGGLVAMSSVEASLGRDDDALRMMERARTLNAKLYGEEHKNTLLITGYVSGIHLKAKRIDTAAALIDMAVRKAERTMPEHFQELAILRIRLGGVRYSQKRYRESIDAVTQGLLSLEKTSSTPTNITRGARATLQKAHLALGDSVAAAQFADPNGRFATSPAPATAAPAPAPAPTAGSKGAKRSP